MLNVQNKNSSYFVEWIPNNIKARSTIFVSLCCVTSILHCRSWQANRHCISWCNIRYYAWHYKRIQKVCSLIHILRGLSNCIFCNVSCCWTYWTNTRIEGILESQFSSRMGFENPAFICPREIQPVGKGVPVLMIVRRNWLTFRYLSFGRPPCATFLPKDWRWLWPLLEIPLRFRRCSKELPSGLFLHFFRGETTISSAVFRLVELFRVLLQLSSQRYVRMV